MPGTRVELAEIALPEFGLPRVEPAIPAATYEARIVSARQRASDAGYDVLMVYADREHFANLAYLTGFDPRFEEALLILTQDRIPTLLVGNEDMAYTAIGPIELQPVLYQTFSLLSQPRSSSAPLTRNCWLEVFYPHRNPDARFLARSPSVPCRHSTSNGLRSA